MRALVLLVLLALTAPAAAHQTSVKYIDLAVRDAHALDVTLRAAATDLADTDATTWFAIAGCTHGPATTKPEGTFVVITYAATCTSTRELTLDFTPFFALDTRHEAIVRVTAPGTSAIQTIVRASGPRVTLRAGHSPSLLAWIGTGMDHIYSGLDHILFVISLLLVVMLMRGEGGAWQVRAFLPTLRATGLVITAFTIAHSITLIAAALGLVALPSRFVESMIAVSIVYTAVEDVVNPAVRWRFVLTFGFGLIHGLGFAATLAELLPPTDVVVPLLCFNVGVEIGQLTIVACVLPVLYLVARKLGPERYRRYALAILAAPIVLVGISMVADRVT